MITSEILNIINILPDASYWEECFIRYFAYEELNISLLPVDFFQWFSDVAHKKCYFCLVPDIDIFWLAMFKIYCDVLEMKFDVFHRQMIKYICDVFNTFGVKYIGNISVERVNWLIKLKESDIPTNEVLIDEIKNALVSNLEKHNYINKEAIEKFKEKCRKDSELQDLLLEERSRISYSLLEQQKS